MKISSSYRLKLLPPFQRLAAVMAEEDSIEIKELAGRQSAFLDNALRSKVLQGFCQGPTPALKTGAASPSKRKGGVVWASGFSDKERDEEEELELAYQKLLVRRSFALFEHDLWQSELCFSQPAILTLGRALAVASCSFAWA